MGAPELVGGCVPPRGPSLSLMGVLQQSMRENKEKQALSDLMIKPVQRIPRYELLVKVGDTRVALSHQQWGRLWLLLASTQLSGLSGVSSPHFPPLVTKLMSPGMHMALLSWRWSL